MVYRRQVVHRFAAQAVRLALVTGAVTTATASAQESEPDAGESIEEIVVTGSRIKRRDFTSPSPLATVGRDAIDFSAQPSLESVLNQMPQVVPDFSRTSNNPGDGTARINLRGVGAGRTLVLLNGRRLAPSGVGSAIDVNNLPQALIDRVEIITGGATTVYGSDAVAGVVNFITREDFTGLSLDASASVSGESDAQVYDLNLVWGHALASGRGHLVAYAGYQDRESLLAGERDLTSVALNNNNATGELQEAGAPQTPEGVIFAPPVDFGNGPERVTFDANGVPRAFVDPDDRYNFQPSNYLQTPLTRTSAGLLVSLDVAGDKELYFETSYARNDVDQQLAPAPAVLLAEVATQSPFLTPEAQAFFAANYEVAPGLSAVGLARRLVEVGPRIVDHQREYWRTVAGVRGGLFQDWEFDAWFTYTDSNESEQYFNDASASRLAQGLLVDPLTGECVDPSGGCVPVDVFGPGQITAEAAAFIRVDDLVNETKRTQALASAYIRGDLLKLPAGALQSAFGLEWRSDDASFSAHEVLFTGDTLAFRGTAPVDGRETVAEAYAEFQVPLLQDARWAEYAGVEAGARYSHYDNAGGIWTYKIGGEWLPVASVRFRAMHQRSVRAPNNAELFTEQYVEDGVIEGDQDPCSASNDPLESGAAEKCVLQGLPPAALGVFEAGAAALDIVLGGNPDLEPETAETWTAGVVLTPDSLPAWTFAFDYFDLEVTESIGEIEALEICFDQNNTGNLFCDNISRDPASGNISEIRQPLSNRGLISARGVDTQVTFAADLPQWLEYRSAASLQVDLTWTHTIESRFQQNAVTETVECAGYFGSYCSQSIDGGSYSVVPANRVTTQLSYASGAMMLHLTSRWIDGARNFAPVAAGIFGQPEPLLAIPEIGSRHYLDIGAGYQFTDAITARVGVDNLADTDAPNMANQALANNTDASLYDVFGRTYYLNLTATLWQ
jgi:iron complex outermembrane recepter protein